LWEACTRAEASGPHPGQLAMRVEARLYNAALRYYRAVPGWRVELTVGSFGALEESREMVERALRNWTAGARPLCARCGSEVKDKEDGT
jgi:hypothetical protein